MFNLRMKKIRKTEEEKRDFAKWAMWANENGYVIVPDPKDLNMVYAQKIGEKEYLAEQSDGSVVKLPYNPTGKCASAEGVEIVEFLDGKTYIKGKEPPKTNELIRNVRDAYLRQYIDPIVTNPLRWEELDEKEKENYKNYRLYLLEIPQKKKFPNVDVLKFEYWKKENE